MVILGCSFLFMIWVVLNGGLDSVFMRMVSLGKDFSLNADFRFGVTDMVVFYFSISEMVFEMGFEWIFDFLKWLSCIVVLWLRSDISVFGYIAIC
jgi:hypothetical protein